MSRIDGPREKGRLFGLSVEEDVDREIQAHLEARAEELVQEGWDRASAVEEARRLFGDVGGVARECRAITRGLIRAERRWGMFEALWQDLRYGIRTLLRAPEFAFVGILTLGLGIGANTAIFSVVDGVLLEPLPYDEPSSIVSVREDRADGGTMAVAWANLVDWHGGSTSFEALSAYRVWTTTILGTGTPLRSPVAPISEDFWSVFRVRPMVGRLTVPADHVPGSAPVVVVSERFWRNQLGAPPIDEASIEFQGVVRQVVGVVSADFEFPGFADAWFPLPVESQSDSRTAHNWAVVGRLAPGVAVPAAHEELEALTLRLVADEPADPDFLAAGVSITTLHEQIVGRAARSLYLLLGAAGLVLLVACTNLASTLLARGASRARELSVRASLGAPRRRVVRQLLTENFLLAAAGAAVGVGIGDAAVRALKALGPTSVPRLDQVAVDGSVLAFTALVAVGTVLLFGFLPARRLARGDVGSALREGDRGNAGDGRGRIWRVLVGAEVAMALFLLAGSATVVRSFQNLLGEDTGVDGADVATLATTLSQVKYASADEQAIWYGEFVRELEALPGVSSAGVITSVPLGGVSNGRLELDGDPEKHAIAGYVLAGPGTFEALDIPLLEGRVFDQRDGPDGAHVAVVSRSFADTYWPGEDPIGKSVSGGGMDSFWDQNLFSTVVGVVGDVRYTGLDREPMPAVYFSYMQRPERIEFGSFVVAEASTEDAAGIVASLRSTLQRMDPDVPPRITLAEERLQRAVAPERFVMLLLGGFAVLSLILSGAGIYGVVSYQVAQRTREMGIRLALGGQPSRVRGMVVLQSLAVVAVGLGVGAVAVYAGGSVLQSQLYGVEPTDALSLLAGVLILGAAGFVASWVPAYRGTRVDPMITMRSD